MSYPGSSSMSINIEYMFGSTGSVRLDVSGRTVARSGGCPLVVAVARVEGSLTVAVARVEESLTVAVASVEGSLTVAVARVEGSLTVAVARVEGALVVAVARLRLRLMRTVGVSASSKSLSSEKVFT
jgi:hypothetical protein